VNVLRRAHDQGITIYDTANMYLDSEEKIGMAFRRLRDKVIIASKSIRRDAAGMTEHVEKSSYDLPIPDMLKSFYDLYEQHRKCLLT
jgi:hypothetical protein